MAWKERGRFHRVKRQTGNDRALRAIRWSVGRLTLETDVDPYTNVALQWG